MKLRESVEIGSRGQIRDFDGWSDETRCASRNKDIRTSRTRERCETDHELEKFMGTRGREKKSNCGRKDELLKTGRKVGKEKEEGEREGATTRERKKDQTETDLVCSAAVWCSHHGHALRCGAGCKASAGAGRADQRQLKGTGRATGPMGSGPLWPWGVLPLGWQLCRGVASLT